MSNGNRKIETKPAAGPSETRALAELPQILLTLAEAQQGAQNQPAPQAQQGSEGGDPQADGVQAAEDCG